ncbi:MAG TPA: GGDEF domain-containing protein [Burkholderiales bacterium]|nr:GGDEF domain-containing protein [Burkholderiales bacterium]
MTAGVSPGFKDRAAALRERLAVRDDTEHLQALIRIAFGIVFAIYLLAVFGPGSRVWIYFVVFEAMACALLAAILVHPQPSGLRRAIGAVVDMGTTTFFMWDLGERGAAFFGVYLWVTFGNGFRYGVRSLYASQALSLAGFAIVIAFNPFWREHPLLAGGLLVTLAAVPAYGAVLLKQVEAANSSLRDQAMRDVLTGLYNRRYLMDAFERELHRARRAGEQLGLLVIDIDHFKRINDTFGHAAGDEVLRCVARFMLGFVRAGDILCRLGGEEFVLLQPKAHSEAIVERADTLRRQVSSLEIVHHGRRIGPVTMSIGISIFPRHGTSPGALLHAADDALYRAKNSGRNRVLMAVTAEEKAARHALSERDSA